jgi:hypothetical protein
MSMSELSLMHGIAVEKFRRAFGEPTRIEGKDLCWGLRPFSYVAAINVVLNGGKDRPVVWIFNPHEPTDGIWSATIENDSEIDTIIKRIEDTVRTAGRPKH